MSIQLTPAVQDLIQRIYLAAADATRWPAFLATLCTYVNGATATLTFLDKENASASVSTSVGFPPGAWDEYYGRFMTIDPFLKAATERDVVKPGFIGLVQDLIADEDLERTEFYQSFAARTGYIGGIVCVVFAEGPLMAIVGVNRRPKSFFGEEEVRLFQVLLPHLRTAMQIHRELLQQMRLGSAALATLNRLQSAVFICDQTSRVLQMNSAARRLERAWVRAGTLVSPLDGAASLRRAVAEAASSSASRDNESDPHLLILGAPAARTIALVSPVQHQCVMDMTHPLVAVMIPSQDLSTGALAQIVRLYGLTKAEGRLALALVSGLTLQEAGATLSITYETARCHLKRVFGKTHTKSQAQLVRALLTAVVAH